MNEIDSQKNFTSSEQQENAPLKDLIFETPHFVVERAPRPFVSREEGGHIRIFPKDRERITDRSKLTPVEAIEFMRLSIAVGEAMEKALNEKGIPVVKINYEDLGNWAFKEKNKQPVLHMHIFGRAKDAKVQKFPEAVNLPDRSSGLYENFVPLNDEDIALIKKYIEELLSTDKFADENWHL
jgi:diadenosine tetraphosphate (Ap4A) HIT family hydrolase